MRFEVWWLVSLASVVRGFSTLPRGGCGRRLRLEAKSPWSFDEARQYARSFGFATADEYKEYRCPGAYALPRDPETLYGPKWRGWPDFLGSATMETILFIETGTGCDGHGQDPTKAAVRACRNAIEFNSIPSIPKIVPGGYEGMKLKIDIALPEKYHSGLDWQQIRNVFPYGTIVDTNLQVGGAIFQSGIAISSLGDSNEDMIVALVAVTVGY